MVYENYSFKVALGRWFESNLCLITGITCTIILSYAYEYISRKGDSDMSFVAALISTFANLCLNFVAQSAEQGLP
jgi:hypothetical protein